MKSQNFPQGKICPIPIISYIKKLKLKVMKRTEIGVSTVPNCKKKPKKKQQKQTNKAKTKNPHMNTIAGLKWIIFCQVCNVREA